VNGRRQRRSRTDYLLPVNDLMFVFLATLIMLMSQELSQAPTDIDIVETGFPAVEDTTGNSAPTLTVVNDSTVKRTHGNGEPGPFPLTDVLRFVGQSSVVNVHVGDSSSAQGISRLVSLLTSADPRKRVVLLLPSGKEPPP